MQHAVASETADGRPPAKRHRGLVTLERTGHRVGVVGNIGFGAPMAASVVEEFVALGATHFIAIGTAGALQPGFDVGHPIVCERAVRDEGVSHHYLPSAKYVGASPRLAAALVAELTNRGVAHSSGASWTTDALFRETEDEVQHYRTEGVLCVEMEAAALFAVGSYRRVETASVFVVSDSLADVVWQPRWDSGEVRAALTGVYEAAVSVLARECRAEESEACRC